MLQEWLLCGKCCGPELGDSREFATLYLQDSSHIRAWFHHPSLLDAPFSAVTVKVDGLQIGSPPQTEPQLIAVSAVDDEANVYEMEFDSPLQNGNRVTVHFNSDSITERDTGRPLSDVLNLADYVYLNRDGSLLSTYLAIASGHFLDDLADVTAPAPAEGDALIFSAGVWTSGSLLHSNLDGLSADDHTNYSHLDGLRPLRADLDAGNHRIMGLIAASANGEAVPFQQAIKTGQAALGDVAGSSFPSLVLSRLQGNPVNAAAPNTGDVLTWTGTEWLPQQATGSTSRPLVILPFAQIIRAEARKYEVWFNLDAPENHVAIDKLSIDAMAVHRENETPPRFLTSIKIDSISNPPLRRNLFNVVLDSESELLRFTFNLEAITALVQLGGVIARMSLQAYINESGVTFNGHNPRAGRVTIFFRNPSIQE